MQQSAAQTIAGAASHLVLDHRATDINQADRIARRSGKCFLQLTGQAAVEMLLRLRRRLDAFGSTCLIR